MKKSILLLTILLSLTYHAQQDGGKKDLEAALKAANTGDPDAFVYNLTLFSNRINDQNITPEKLSPENLDLYTETLYTATWKELKIPSELQSKTIEFLSYKAEEKPKNMASLGYLYYNGKGVSQDFTKAKYWYEKASNKGERLALRGLGHLYKDGKGVVKDYNKSFAFFKEAAEKGDVNSMSNLGWMYMEGHGTAKNTNDAVFWYKKAVQEGNNAYSMNGLGNYYYNVEKNYSQAEKYYKDGCNLGNAWACSNLAGKYQYIDKNYDLAVKIYKQALAIEHNDRAAYELGRIFSFDFNMETYNDKKYAISMLTKVSKEYELYYDAMNFVGEIYKKESDYRSAIYYFQLAAQAGLPRALNNLGVMYHNGTGVSKDLTIAYGYYLWAVVMGEKDNASNNIKILEKNGAYVQNQEQAINGVVNACLGFKQNFITEGEILYNLAMILKTGSGLKKSSKDAEYWFQKSCEKGYKEACNNL